MNNHKTIVGTILTHALSNATVFLFIGGAMRKHALVINGHYVDAYYLAKLLDI